MAKLKRLGGVGRFRQLVREWIHHGLLFDRLQEAAASEAVRKAYTNDGLLRNSDTCTALCEAVKKLCDVRFELDLEAFEGLDDAWPLRQIVATTESPDPAISDTECSRLDVVQAQLILRKTQTALDASQAALRKTEARLAKAEARIDMLEGEQAAHKAARKELSKTQAELEHTQEQLTKAEADAACKRSALQKAKADLQDAASFRGEAELVLARTAAEKAEVEVELGRLRQSAGGDLGPAAARARLGEFDRDASAPEKADKKAALLSEQVAALQKRLEETQAACDMAQSAAATATTLTEHNRALTTELASVKAACEAAELKAADLTHQVTTRGEAHTAHVLDLSTQLRKSQTECESVRTLYAAATRQLETAQVAHAKLETAQTELKKSDQVLRQKLTEASTTCKKVQAEFDSLKTAHAALKQTTADQCRELTALHQVHTDVVAEHAAIKTCRDQIEVELEQLRQAHSELQDSTKRAASDAARQASEAAETAEREHEAGRVAWENERCELVQKSSDLQRGWDNERSTLQAEIMRTEALVKAAQSQVTAIRFDSSQAKIESQRVLAATQHELQECKNALAAESLRLQGVEAKNVQLAHDNDALREENRQLDQRRSEAASSVKQLTVRLNDAQRDNIAALERHKKNEAEHNSLQEQLTSATAEIVTLQKTIHALTEREADLILEHGTKVAELEKQLTERNTNWVWDDDAVCTHCVGCKSEFSLFLRKHHCRCCGKVFCNSCMLIT